MRRILVGLDGSEREPGVLSAARDLAERYGAELILFRAVGLPAEVPAEAYLKPEISVLELLQEKATAALEAALRTIPEPLHSRARLKLSIANPWRGVCAAAAEEQVDLIVIGSHGYGALDHVLGTNAARIVNHARCSVFVVREGRAGAGASPASP
jgi:nucleotide-binding universal stress UspA family protein